MPKLAAVFATFYMTSINHMKTQTLEIYGNSTAKVAQKSKMKEGTKQTRITNGDWHGKHIKRVEAAVSPNYKYLMIATVWTDNSGHFGLC